MPNNMEQNQLKGRAEGRLWPRLLLFLAVAISMVAAHYTNTDFLCSFEKPICRWRWNTTASNRYRIMSGDKASRIFDQTGQYAGPLTDADNKTSGHYLQLHILSGTEEVHLWSTRLSNTMRDCTISVWLNMINMTYGKFLAVIEGTLPWVIGEMNGNNRSTWERYRFPVGRVRQEFNFLFAVEADGENYPAHVSLDQIELEDCFQVTPKPGYCTTEYFTCNPNTRDFCLNRTQICDLRIDCLNMADEKLGCDAVPAIGRCDFEENWCGWHNSPDTIANWTSIVGIMETPRRTGPAYDRRYNETTTFLYANMSSRDLRFGEMALLDSSILNPPPLYHSRPESKHYLSCNVRFFYHQYGLSTGSFSLYVIEHQPHGDRTTRLFYSFGDQGDNWIRSVVTIPTNLRNTYHLQFEVRRGVRPGGVALDDVTLSPECFGLNVPEKDKEGYNYDTFKGFPGEPTLQTETHSAFVNKTVYTFTTCGSVGRTGPTPENCTKAYNNTNIEVTVVDDPPISGVQKWIVPETHFYTIIAKGASGGSGPDARGTSKGASAIGIIKLFKGQELYILVGQEGNGGCRQNFAMTQHHSCGRIIPPKPTPPGPRYSPPRSRQPSTKLSPIEQLRRLAVTFSGGGGGGGSFVYLIGPDGRIPLIIGAGGGGLGGGRPMGETSQNGRGTDPTRSGLTGEEYGINPPGAGGGWNSTRRRAGEVTGTALQEGALGGHGCGTPKGYFGMGGFGGGGGGCTSGGGGGGYSGGSASSQWKNGRGGYSYVSFRMRERRVLEGSNDGPGSVIIIPAVTGCNCEYLCGAVDEYLEYAKCICPNGEILGENMPNCAGEEHTFPSPTITPAGQLLISVELVYAFIATVAISIACLMGQIGYKCYKRAKKLREIRRRVAEPEVADVAEPTENIELQSLDQMEEAMVTEQNPTYETAGPVVISRLPDRKEIPSIPRDSLTFDKSIGRGAFGEVFLGYYKENNEAESMPVAIKTLPAFASSQAASDFYMEALMMSKFDHPNVVRFIGVCFDRQPHFIVLELMPGGDLKRFLVENRPHVDDPDRLTMKDLLGFAKDVALGCNYLEERMFIHRDVAARNCLLTSRGEDRRVKIADFGMAKDIYRSQYYRKIGMAMIPVKWMPPEAFQDGIFTTKTDIWSYGVFLWELMTLGLMPYSTCDNLEVMQFIVRGGRLKIPRNCPREIYDLMRLCWETLPDDRPTFSYILERIEHFMQDPAIMGTKLPLFDITDRSSLTEEPRTSRVTDIELAPRLEAAVTVHKDGDGNVRAPAAEPSQITYAETEFIDPQPGTSKSVLGKSSYTDSSATVFEMTSEPSDKEKSLQGFAAWCNKGKAKTFDFTRRWSLSDVLPLETPTLELEMPVISAPRGPLGPKGRLRPSEIKKYHMTMETIGKIDRENLDSADSDSDSEKSTYF